MSYAVLVDVTKCTGCEQCVTACVEAHRSGTDPVPHEYLDKQAGLSAHRLNSIEQVADGRFARKSCMHCLEPSCVSACLVGALAKTEEGAVLYDPEKCIGCRYCMLACPFHVPQYEWEALVPFVKKCDMCATRVESGGQPACVDACSNGVLTFGDRDELLKIAHARIDSAGSSYIKHVWGEDEFGGTSVLYISDVDLAELDWPESHPVAIPHLTESLIESTPFIGLGVASSLLSINWVIRRRMKLERETPESDHDAETPDTETLKDD